MQGFASGRAIELVAGGGRSVLMRDCQGRDQVVHAWAAHGWESFEKPMPRIFRDCVRQSSGAVVDVGANTGFYTILAAAARDDVRIIAVEPDPRVRPVLEDNVRLNKLESRVAVIASALSDREGAGTLFLPAMNHGCVETSSSLEESFKASHEASVAVPLETLDCVARRAGADRIGILKIDVEGHEAAVLRGAGDVIRRNRPLVFVEILPGADFGFFNDFLKRFSYADFPLGKTVRAAEVAFHEDAWNHLMVPEEEAGRIGRDLIDAVRE
jgi:FkbM family methyltransferase